jgi:hypothetical protein
MTRAGSDGAVPQRLIHRRSGNQYSTANVRITRRVGIMWISLHLNQEAHDAAERSVIAPRSPVRFIVRKSSTRASTIRYWLKHMS